MIKLDDEEKKKRYERAIELTRSMSGQSSSNFNNITLNNLTGNTDEEKEYIKRYNRARELTNSINPRENIPAPSLTQEQIDSSAKFRDELLNDLNKNVENNNTNSEIKNENKSIEQKEEVNSENQENKNPTLFDKAKYIGKRGLAEMIGGTVGIGQAGLTDAASNMQKGKEKSLASNLTDTFQSIVNPSNFVIKNTLKNYPKEVLSTILDKDKSPIQKFVALATNATSEGMNSIIPQKNTLLQLTGKVIPDIDQATLNLNEQITAPIRNWKNKLYEEGQNYGAVTNTLGNVSGAVGNMIPSIAGTLLTKNPTVGLATMGISAKGQSTQEALDKGAELNEAVRIGDTKGMIEVGTEMLTGGVNIFGKGALDDLLKKGIVDRVKNNVIKFFVKQGVNASGEILEETISDILGTVIDKGSIDSNASYSIKDWSKTALETTLTTFALNLLTGGLISDIKGIKKDNNSNQTNYDVSDIKSYFALEKDVDGNITNAKYVNGIEIDNPNKKVNINPAIVKNNELDVYNVIDSETGIILDSTPYDSILSARVEFNHNILNLSEEQVNDINRNVEETKMNLYERINDYMQSEEYQNITLQKEQNDTIEQNNIESQEINSEENKMAQNEFSEELNRTETEQVNVNNNQEENISFDDVVSDAMQDVAINEAESPLNDRNIETIGKQQNVNAYQYDNPEVKPYFQEMAQMIGEDLSYISSQENKSSLKGGGSKLNTTTSAINTLHNEMGYSYEQISKGLQNIIEDNGKENNAISKKLELIIDDQLRNGYINALGKKVAPNQVYINNIKIEDINSALPRKSGSKDFESISSVNNSIPQNEELSKSIVNFKNAMDTVNREDIINIANSLNIKIKKDAHKIIDVRMQQKSGHNIKPRITNITKLFENITNNNAKKFRKQAIEKALELYRDEEVTIKDTESIAEINKSGIKETFSKGLTKEKIQSSDNIKDIIEEGIYSYTTQDNSDINSILYHHYFSPVNYEGTNGIVRVIIKEFPLDKTAKDKFYYHQIEYISGEDITKEGSALSYPTTNSDNKTVELQPSSINNSIPQKTKKVKSDKTVINKDMQKNGKNTVRDLKKQNSELTKVQYDSTGKKITKQQQEYFKNSKVRDENGILLEVYHGTNKGGFTVFNRNMNYYTSNEKVAKSYTSNSSIYKGYLNITNPLIIEANGEMWSKIAIENIQINDIDNIERFLKENGSTVFKEDGKLRTTTADIAGAVESAIDDGILDYDGIIINNIYDEGMYGNDTLRKQLGNDYITFKSNQFKNSNNKNPTSNEDIRYLKKGNTQTSNNTIRQDKQQDIKINQDNIDKSYKTNQERADAWIEQEIKKIEETGNWDNTIPATSLTDIRNTIEDYLGLGVKKGKFRQTAYGIYKADRGVIRAKEYSDIDTILHETGHALDLGNRIDIDKESIADELINAIDRLGGYEDESRTVKLEEGFAEVIREYSIIPEQAKKEFPKSVAIIEGIRQNDNSFDKFISKVQQQTYNYIHQNPQNRVHSKQSIGEQTDKPQMSKAWIEQEVKRAIWDKDIAVKNVVEELAKVSGKTTNQIKASNNAYYLTRLATGMGDKVTSMLADGYINNNGEKIMPGLNKVGEILGDDPQRYNDLRDYLVARRDTDYKAKTLKTGIRDMDTQYVIEKFKEDAQIQEAAQVVYDTLDGVMKYAVENGLISEDDVKSLKESNAFYVPMQRVIEGRGNQVGRKGAVKDIIKARTGSELDIKDVLENIVANSSNIIQQVENNNVLKALYNQGEEAGLTGSIYDVIDTPMMKVGTANLSMWETELKKQGVDTSELDLEKTVDLFAPNNKVDTKNLITSFINEDGKRVYLQFNDEILFNSLMNLDGKVMSNVLKINSKLNMPLRYGATMANIGFAIPNMISDTAQATVYSNAGFLPIIDNALGVLDVLTATNDNVKNFVKNYSPEYVNRIENMYSIYKQTGATNSTRMSQFRETTQNNMKDIYGTKNSEILGINEKYKPLKRLLDIMTYIPEVSEQSTRFRVFEKNYDMYKEKGNNEMDSRILAALESRDATQDFGRTGNLTREINQLIPFSAARIGSGYTFAEKVKANPKQTAMRIAVLSAIALAIKTIGYDDKEIEELNQRKKDDNFVLKAGDNIITIKKPQGILRSIINLTEYIQDLATGHIENGKEGERLGQWINNAIMDNMPADSVTGLVPNMVAPLIENAINKDFYYNTDIVKSYDLDLPDSEQYYDYNSQLAILLGKAFNYSPAKIDNLISGYFAGLGTQVTNIMDYVSGKMGITAQKPEMGAESNAVGKRFIVNVNSNSASIDEIYNRKTELTKKKNGGTITSEEETELSNITNAVTNMSKVNKQIKEIKKDLTMSGKEKAEKIKELQKQRTDIARQALGKELLNSESAEQIETTSFYPSTSTLSMNNNKLELTSDMKQEYSKLASEFYKKYESQGIYSEEKLKEIKTKAKDYAKKTLMQKYKSQVVRNK